MKRFAFLSRHMPTQRQHELAAEKGIELVKIEDMDAFAIDPEKFPDDNGIPFDGVVVVHPAAAMQLCSLFEIGVFENANHAPIGEWPQFEARALHICDLRDWT